MGEPFFITTAIPYVNAAPHIGFALEAVLADAIARAHRDLGYDVRFQTGTDDNSLKSVRAAERAGVPVAGFVRAGAGRFRALVDVLDLAVDDFISTSTDPRHPPGAQALWRACDAAGDVYRRAYGGLYCVGCEAFVRDGRCDEHDTEPEEVAEENHFFRLSRYRERVRALIASGELAVAPASRRAEILALADDADDFSVSRSVQRARGWGVPVPGDPSQVQYVWFDALGNYLTALGYPERTEAFARWWDGDGRRVHVIGKNITRFHALYWPAFLLSAGLRLPTALLVHGFVTTGGRKLAKSGGPRIDPVAVARRFGSDALRYFLLRAPADADLEFNEGVLEQVYRSELADQLGNLASRTIALVERDLGGVVPGLTGLDASHRELLVRAARAEVEAREAYRALAPDRAIAAVRALVAETNRRLAVWRPWELVRVAGPGDERFRAALATTAEVLAVVGVAARPVVPKAADALLGQLGLDGRAAGAAGAAVAAGARVRPGAHLFPRSRPPTTSGRTRPARR